MSEQLPFAGPEKGLCPCDDPACGKFGTLRTKVMLDGKRHCKGCPCRRCRGSRYGKNARARENRIAKKSNMERAVLSGAISGYDLIGPCVVEETANVSLNAGLFRWFDSAKVQGKLARLFSLSAYKPKAFIASRRGKPELVVMKFEDWNTLQMLAGMAEEKHHVPDNSRSAD